MITVSVILPTYNAEATVKATLQSVLSQTGAGTNFKLEVIVIDDCSTDRTVSIVESMKIPVISTVKNSGGPNTGRNIGLDRATGDFITFIDHDDIWHPEKISKQLDVAFYCPIVTTGYIVQDLKNKSNFERGSDDGLKFFSRNETFLSKLTRKRKGIQCTYPSGIMINSYLKHIRFEETYGMLDYDWTLRLFENQNSVEITFPMFTRKVASNNLSLNKQYRENDYNYFIHMLQLYKSRYPHEVSRAQRRMNGSMGRYFYKMGQMKEARQYLIKSRIGLAEVAYLITSYYGSPWVNRKFAVFG